MLAITRFHVATDTDEASVENHDRLFSICWSEMAELIHAGEPDTGSLIILPDYDMSLLKRFADMNLTRPLQWLGINADFEVATFHRGSPAIRILYKLSDIPELPTGDRKDTM